MTLSANAEYQRAYRKRYPEKASACVRRWHAANAERVREIKRQYRERHRDAIRVKSRAHSLKSYRENSALWKARAQQWRSKNKAVCRALSAERKALKLNATPKWLTLEQREQTRQLYARAAALSKFLGFQCDVDHIQPLRGKDRTGLHVPWNLQILPALANRSKHNKAPEVFSRTL